MPPLTDHLSARHIIAATLVTFDTWGGPRLGPRRRGQVAVSKDTREDHATTYDVTGQSESNRVESGQRRVGVESSAEKGDRADEMPDLTMCVRLRCKLARSPLVIERIQMREAGGRGDDESI